MFRIHLKISFLKFLWIILKYKFVSQCATNIYSFTGVVNFLNETWSLFRQFYTIVSFFREPQAPLKTSFLCELNIGFIYQAVNTRTTRGDKPFISILVSFVNREKSCLELDRRIRYNILIFEKHLEVFLAFKVGVCCRLRLNSEKSNWALRSLTKAAH